MKTKFTEGSTVKTTVKMTTEDVGENIPVGTTGTVFAPPKDKEELVGVVINGTFHYLPQDVLEEQTEADLLKALQFLLQSYRADFKTITGAELNETEAVKQAVNAIKKATGHGK